METGTLWLILGLAGQAMFSLRFLVQWIQSERHRRSVIPVAFWYFSIAGSALLLAYAVHRRDPVFIIGQLGGLVIYARNLHLIAQHRRGGGSSGSGPPSLSGAGNSPA